MCVIFTILNGVVRDAEEFECNLLSPQTHVFVFLFSLLLPFFLPLPFLPETWRELNLIMMQCPLNLMFPDLVRVALRGEVGWVSLLPSLSEHRRLK